MLIMILMKILNYNTYPCITSMKYLSVVIHHQHISSKNLVYNEVVPDDIT